MTTTPYRHCKVMPNANFIVVGVVGWSDLYRSGSELWVGVEVGRRLGVELFQFRADAALQIFEPNLGAVATFEDFRGQIGHGHVRGSSAFQMGRGRSTSPPPSAKRDQGEVARSAGGGFIPGVRRSGEFRRD